MIRSYAALLLIFIPSFCLAQFEEDYGVGLIANYQTPSGTNCRKIDPRVSFNWEDKTPDQRLDQGKFTVTWQGYLLPRKSGSYRLQVFAEGKVKISLAGQVILDKQADKPQWLQANAVDLKFDWHPVVIQYTKTGDYARCGLFWEGPDFSIEPITSASLFYDREKEFTDPFTLGKNLVRSLRCRSCHELDQQQSPLPSPSLSKLAGNISEPWLEKWLSASEEKQSETESIKRRMPHFSLTKEEKKAVAEFLLETSTKTSQDLPDEVHGSASLGKTMFHSLGCLACHQVNDLGQQGFFQGPDLSDIGAKRPGHFFVQWLKEPGKLNADHRMPIYELDQPSRNHLAAYLQSLRTSGQAPVMPRRRYSTTLAQAGRELVIKHQCFACHQLGSNLIEQKSLRKSRITPGSIWHDACLAQPHPAGKHPGYQLTKTQKEAIKNYLRGIAKVTKRPTHAPDGLTLIQENNCLACHPRGLKPGLSETAQLAAKAVPRLSSQLPAMVPPSLNSVGDKLGELTLHKILKESSNEHRPWLKVKMPKFQLTELEQFSIIKALVDADRVPDHSTFIDPIEDPALKDAGARLVTTDGFGCTSCHQIGDSLPTKAPLNALGPDLSMLGNRIRKSWFDRWVRNPARIVPRMEMPSVQVPVQGVLQDDLHQQLAAVWHVLNTPDFQPPNADAVRVARRAGIAELKEPTLVLTDILQQQERKFIKPLLVGLPNRHNVVFDLETASLASWHLGDTARQHCEGKTWFWRSGNSPLWQQSLNSPDIEVYDPEGKKLPVIKRGQFYTEFDSINSTAQGITWRYRLTFGDKTVPELVVEQQLQPLWRDDSNGVSGFYRKLRLSQLPPDYQVRLILSATDQSASSKIDISGRSMVLQKQGDVSITNEDQSFQKIHQDKNLNYIVLDSKRWNELRYTTTRLTDQYLPKPEVAAITPEPSLLELVPGWHAMRLPISSEIMPTAIDWQTDGTMFATSLKGRVWKITDQNGDNLEDTAVDLGVELATPFGVKAHDQYLDVINKYGLLRLTDQTQDGTIDKTERLASGWGHTADYHDWTVGLPSDEQGNYYIATSCQQDDRSLAAAHWRGSVLKLSPNQSSGNQQQKYLVEEISAGHRFPIGIARNQQGELFVTDNQGHWNPFNELNHVIAGKRYGFINKVDRKPDFQPAETPPSIAIPHPWTRSVNGICFLETPKQLRQKLGYPLFGAFEGHLIGCEYDTRRLVRMSLDQVGETIQGAVYPFTTQPHKDASKALLGPVTCSVAPSGDLYIGNMRDAGWGGGNNIGSFVRMKPKSVHLPLGIAEVKATASGFIIRFTDQVDAEQSQYHSFYKINSYTRQSTPTYGGKDQQVRSEQISEIKLSADRLSVMIKLAELREGFVYEIYIDDEIAGAKKKLWPNEAYYTMRKIPNE